MKNKLWLVFIGLLSVCPPGMAIPVSNAYIGIAGTGGDFSGRSATFRVPDKTTTTPVKDGLRLYEVHLAKMLEVSAFYCRDREPTYKMTWNYQAEQGKVFMGELAWTCQFANDAFKKFGSSGQETLTIHYVDNPKQETISTLNITGKNAKGFMQLVETIKPKCIGYKPPICPGDRLE